MEKFSQFRDRGSGIAPFLPIHAEPSGFYLPFHIFLFFFRFPIILATAFTYFFVLQWLPIGSLGKKGCLWVALGTPGIWWYDLKVEGVKKGSLAKHHKTRFPQPGTIIAATFTSPIDVVYLATIFDPIFTQSYPSTRLIRRVSLFQAIVNAFTPPRLTPDPDADLTTLQTLLQKNPHRSIVVFPECTTSNGRAILPFGPSLLTTPPRTRIFPMSLRYNAADVVTPAPGMQFRFTWNLMSRPTHCIRVRIAEPVYNNSQSPQASPSLLSPNSPNSFSSLHSPLSPAFSNSTLSPRSPNFPMSPSSPAFSTSGLSDAPSSQPDESESDTETLLEFEEAHSVSEAEKRVLDSIAEALARMGRVKRVGLGVKEKREFVKAWARQRNKKGKKTS
ncbi:hypothetical protein MMC25_008100 [Agyrium rufum]|nr:hypothetical protein [Agyrium rufum]